MTARLLFFLAFLVFGCQSKQTSDIVKYPDQFGEIPFNPELDNPDFQLCNDSTLVHSRVSLSYQDGRIRIEEISKEIFANHGQTYSFDGYVIARFLVNCHGQVGRLRIESLDDGFMPQAAPEGLLALINTSVKALNEWTITKPSNEGKDHSKYLNFKIKNGQIDAIIH